MPDTASDSAYVGAATGAPLVILKAEGLAVFALATFAYSLTGQNWWFYLILFLFRTSPSWPTRRATGRDP